MEKLPIHYRAAVRPRRYRELIYGTPGTYDEAEAEAASMARRHNATIVLIEKTDPWPINAGKWFHHRILK